MSGMTSRLAYIARSGERFEYFGNARNGLRIPLASGDSLAIHPEQIQKILDRFSVFNPLLDEFTDHGIFCPTTRFERWVEKESPVFFGRQLKSGDAMRILGAFNGDGLIEEHFHTSIARHGHSPKAGALDVLEECEGQICIYREKAYFARVRLVKVTGDKNGVSLRMKVIDTPGFCSDVAGQFEVGSAFEYLSIPDGHLNFPHLWPGQIPPGQTTVVGGLLLGMGSFRKAVGGLFEAIALALEFEQYAAV